MPPHRTTPHRADLASALQKQLRILLKQLPLARRGNPEDVHRARVATRRLREMLPVAAEAAGSRGCSRIAREVRRITRALGPVREIDVALRECALDAAPPPPVAAGARMARHLQTERARRIRSMRLRLDGVASRSIEQQVRALTAGCDARSSGAAGARAAVDWRTLLAARIRKRALRLGETLQRVGTLYAADPIHAVRIAAKKLRYTMELAETAGAPCGVDVARLRRLQDLLGRLRDLQVLQEHVRAVLSGAAGHRAAAGALAELDASLETQCRALHATFLRGMAQWQAAAEHAARDLPAALIVRRMAKAAPADRTAARGPIRAHSAGRR